MKLFFFFIIVIRDVISCDVCARERRLKKMVMSPLACEFFLHCLFCLATFASFFEIPITVLLFKSFSAVVLTFTLLIWKFSLEIPIIQNELIPNSDSEEGKVFYYKMKGDYHRYLAEVTDTHTAANVHTCNTRNHFCTDWQRISHRQSKMEWYFLYSRTVWTGYSH